MAESSKKKFPVELTDSMLRVIFGRLIGFFLQLMPHAPLILPTKGEHDTPQPVWEHDYTEKSTRILVVILIFMNIAILIEIIGFVGG